MLNDNQKAPQNKGRGSTAGDLQQLPGKKNKQNFPVGRNPARERRKDEEVEIKVVRVTDRQARGSCRMQEIHLAARLSK